MNNYGTAEEIAALVDYTIAKAANHGVTEATRKGFCPDIKADLYEIQIPGAEAFSFTMDELLHANVGDVTVVIS